MDDLARMRGWYAEDLRLRTPVRRNLSVVEAFAAVPRENFLGPGPWRILPDASPTRAVHDARRRAALALSRRAGGDRSGAQAQQRHAELLGAQSRSPRPAARRARAAGRRRHRLLRRRAGRDRRPATAASRRSSMTTGSPRGRAPISRHGARSRSWPATAARTIRARSTRSWCSPARPTLPRSGSTAWPRAAGWSCR